MEGQEVHEQAVTAASSEDRQATGPKARAELPGRIDRDPGEFAFLVSHDLKQPLQGIRAYCEILLEDYQEKLDGDGRRRLNAMITLCDRLAGSIDSLLEYYRLGQVPAAEAEVDLNAVVDDVLEMLSSVIDTRHASVHVVDRLPVVRGDAPLIAKVFSNLVSNGLKFNRSEAPRVEIGSGAGDPPVIYVRDNGIGIPQEHHEEVFSIFRRLDSRREYEGAGAGLTIVRKIVALHGGRVWLESEPGRGTTFLFTLSPPEAQTTGANLHTRAPHWKGRPRPRPTRRAGKRQGTAEEQLHL